MKKFLVELLLQKNFNLLSMVFVSIMCRELGEGNWLRAFVFYLLYVVVTLFGVPSPDKEPTISISFKRSDKP